jgi:hypothetical protein
MPLLPFLAYLTTRARERGDELRRKYREFVDARGGPDAGYSTETVLVTALLVVLALGVLAVIATKVIAKANSISLN